MNNTKIIRLLEEEGIEITENIEEAIYIMADGCLISGMFNGGVRGIDHRIIESLFDDIDRDSDDFWGEALKRTHFVMCVPETNAIILKNNQVITGEQIKVIDQLKKVEYKVEYF
ncbi:hypothetical protein O0M08_11035 [Staphylococcus pseudintermedius]|nr:hypothetical protein [Staphylococcus pseudintermedius]MDF0323184.1 hypothetical protein [Staphylococcus pseudintermedius]MDF0327729.1 hypothetical protein [Staphylococcus pseudintermedius]MDF0332079.1 hypothetical protein [Staphylococcus pseudintermedius]MDF0336722.1 hypothetical protein [Staphylococcus pseudintermedius]